MESYLQALIPALLARGHNIAFLHHRTRREVGPTPLRFDHVPSHGIQDDGFDTVMQRIANWRPEVCFSHNMGPLEVERGLLHRWPVVKMMHGFFGTCISSQKAHAFPSVVPCTRVFGAPCGALYLPRRCGALRPLQALRSLKWNARQHTLLGRYASIVVASRYMNEEYTRHGVRRVVTAPLFPTTDSAGPPRQAPAEATVLFAGRMTELKGPRVLVEATALASRILGRSVKLVMAGDGPDRPALIRAARAAGVRASFPGWVSGAERTALLRAASIVAVPSLWPEPFGLIGLEASAHGVPSVAFDVGGISEWLQDGVNGRLVRERGSAEALARTLASVLADSSMLRSLEQGALSVAARMTLDAHLRILQGTFESAAAREPAGARP